jgi:hypothetical protein
MKDFCINNCDITQMSISFLEKGNIKINILDNLLNKIEKKKKSLECDTLINWETSYEESFNKDYNSLFKKMLRQNNYDNIIPILYQDIIKPKYEPKYNDISMFFPSKQSLPPKFFNDIPYNKYLEGISLYSNPGRKNYLFSTNFSSKSSEKMIYSDKLVSHPQLPVYLSSSSNGIIFLYSFYESNNDISKVINEFYLDKIDNDSNHCINKIKFN